jgi:hypothetical protein
VWFGGRRSKLGLGSGKLRTTFQIAKVATAYLLI